MGENIPLVFFVNGKKVKYLYNVHVNMIRYIVIYVIIIIVYYSDK